MEDKGVYKDNIQNEPQLKNMLFKFHNIFSFLRLKQDKQITIDEVLAFSDQMQTEYTEIFPCEQKLELKEFIDTLLLKQLYEKILQNYDNDHDKRIAFYFEVFQFITLKHFECNFDVDSQLFKVAIEHLNKIDHFKTARDKIISINNACKSLSILLQNFKKPGSGADDFLPLLIFTILKAKPLNAWTNFFFTRDLVQPWRNSGQEQYYFTAYESALQFIEQIDQGKLKLSVEEYNFLFNQYYQQAKITLNYEPSLNPNTELLNFDIKKQNHFLLKWVQEFGKEFQQAFSENGLKNISFYQKDLEFIFNASDIKISELNKFHGEYQMLVQKLQYFQKKIDAIQILANSEIKDKTVKQKIFGLLKFN